MEVMGSSAALIFNTLTGIYLLAILLRFLLQVARADFYNPMSQAVFRITDPMVRIFRGFIPGYKGIDFSSFISSISSINKPVPSNISSKPPTLEAITAAP